MQIRPVMAAIAMLAAGTTASAQVYTVDVDAKNNSSTGGTGLVVTTLLAGQSFSVAVSDTDLWSAGALPRWSNANGLTGNLFATGSDESGAVAGTLIGQNFGLHTQSGFSAPFGSLVGQIGAGAFFLIGTAYSSPVLAAGGPLKLFYWDSISGDNANSVSVTVSVVPEPGSLALMLAGLGVVGFLAKRRGVAARPPLAAA